MNGAGARLAHDSARPHRERAGNGAQGDAPWPPAVAAALADATREVDAAVAASPPSADVQVRRDGLERALRQTADRGDEQTALAAVRAWRDASLREIALADALTARIWIGATPPSLNVVAGHRWQWAKAKKMWQNDLALLLMAERLPRGLARVEASAVLTFPTRRRRDEGNFRALIEKSLGDALVEGRWLADDTPDRFSFGAVTFALGTPRTTIDLHCLRGDR